MSLESLDKKLKTAFADGINNAAEEIAANIKSLVPVRTGRLQRSYRVTQLATPEKPTAEVGSTMPYAGRYYPANIDISGFGRRQAQLSGIELLFGNNENETERQKAVNEVVREAIREEI